jgi:hypothetical protein
MYVCMCKGWALSAHAPRPTVVYYFFTLHILLYWCSLISILFGYISFACWSHILTMVSSSVATYEVCVGPNKPAYQLRFHTCYGTLLDSDDGQWNTGGYIIDSKILRWLHIIFDMTNTWLSTVETEQHGQSHASEEPFSLLRSKLNDFTSFLELTLVSSSSCLFQVYVPVSQYF